MNPTRTMITSRIALGGVIALFLALMLLFGAFVPGQSAHGATSIRAIPAACSGVLVTVHTNTSKYLHVSGSLVDESDSTNATWFCRIGTTWGGYVYDEMRQEGTSNCITEDAADFNNLHMEGCDPGDIAAQNWTVLSNSAFSDAYHTDSHGNNNWDAFASNPTYMVTPATSGNIWGWG